MPQAMGAKENIVTSHHSVVAICQSRERAETVAEELRRSGFDMKQFSMVGRGYHANDQVIGYYNAGGRLKYRGGTGVVWGGVWGLMFGSEFLLIPEVGLLIVAGPLIVAILGALDGSTVPGGLGAIGAALHRVGIPKDSIPPCETALKNGNFLVIAHGSPQETAAAGEIIRRTNPEEARHHQRWPDTEGILIAR